MTHISWQLNLNRINSILLSPNKVLNYKNQYKDPLLLDFGSRNATENFNFSFGERTEVWRSCSTVFKARVSTFFNWHRLLFLEKWTPLTRRDVCTRWMYRFVCHGKKTNQPSWVRAPRTGLGQTRSYDEALNKARKLFPWKKRWFAIPILFWNMWNISYARRENSFVFWYWWYVRMSQVIYSLAPLAMIWRATWQIFQLWWRKFRKIARKDNAHAWIYPNGEL